MCVQGRVAEESVATSKKSRFVFEEVDDGNVDDECKEERDIAMFTGKVFVLLSHFDILTL
jgi:hypothetical protein